MCVYTHTKDFRLLDRKNQVISISVPNLLPNDSSSKKYTLIYLNKVFKVDTSKAVNSQPIYQIIHQVWHYFSLNSFMMGIYFRFDHVPTIHWCISFILTPKFIALISLALELVTTGLGPRFYFVPSFCCCSC